jgi:hypothetical protein
MAKKLLVDLVVDRYVNLDLFYRKQESDSNGCSIWTGPKNNAGYGFIGFRLKTADGAASTKMMTVHRLAFMIYNGHAPRKPNVNHTCHNKLCCNPEHLVEGTQQEKLVAMIKDGIKGGGKLGVKRGSYNHKQHNHTYRYSEKEIQWIRTSSSEAIAKKYKITLKQACGRRHAFREGYTWLPCTEGFPKLKRGRKTKNK